jgi:hypothetical protein
MMPKTEGTKIGKLKKDINNKASDKMLEPNMKTRKNIIAPQVISKLKPNSENFILFLSQTKMPEANPKGNAITPKMRTRTNLSSTAQILSLISYVQLFRLLHCVLKEK